MTEIKKPRTPKQPASITAGALKLPLADRVALIKELKASIDTEVRDLKTAADNAASIANGEKPI